MKSSQPTPTAGVQPLPRRSFLARIAGGLSAIGGASLLTGFSRSTRGEMHGPVRQDAAILARPRARDADALFGRFSDGDVIERSWAIGHVTRGSDGQICIVMVDGETTGHAELELWTRGAADGDAIATTRRFAIHLPGPAVGVPAHLERIGARVAAIVGRHEHGVVLDTALPQRALLSVA
jgi:hypothetical protein